MANQLGQSIRSDNKKEINKVLWWPRDDGLYFYHKMKILQCALAVSTEMNTTYYMAEKQAGVETENYGHRSPMTHKPKWRLKRNEHRTSLRDISVTYENTRFCVQARVATKKKGRPLINDNSLRWPIRIYAHMTPSRSGYQKGRNATHQWQIIHYGNQ